MDIKDIFLLRQYIKARPYHEKDFNLDHIFKVYSALAITSVKDFEKVSKEFPKLILSMQDCFTFASPEDKLEFRREIDVYPKYLKGLFETKHALKEDNYTFAVKELAPFKEQTKLLDVGSGQVPYSSIILAKDIKEVSSMDNFLLCSASLNKLGVTAVNGYFNEATNVENYDFIVGQRPCSAIESIVINCHEQNKPYFIELCDCNLDAIAKRDGIYRNWQQILPEIDSQVKFVEGFAFNVDATERQVSNLLYQSKMNAISNRKDLVQPSKNFMQKKSLALKTYSQSGTLKFKQNLNNKAIKIALFF